MILRRTVRSNNGYMRIYYTKCLLASTFTGPFCCDSESHMGSQPFSIRYWSPNARCFDHQEGAETSGNSEQTSRNVYRPVRERGALEKLITDWRSRVHLSDIFTSISSIENILPTKSISLLARLTRNAPELTSDESLASFLRRSKEWTCIYAPELLKLIIDYNSSLPPERKKPNKLEDTPYSQFCSVIDFSSSSANTARSNISRSTPSQSQSQNPPSSSSTTNKRTALESAHKASKRVKLGEISLNK